MAKEKQEVDRKRVEIKKERARTEKERIVEKRTEREKRKIYLIVTFFFCL